MRQVETLYPENIFYLIFNDLINLRINYGKYFLKLKLKITKLQLKVLQRTYQQFLNI